MYAISGNVMHVWRTIYTPHQEIQYIVRHIKKYKKCATLGNTGCTQYHEMPKTIYTPHQEIRYIVRHIRKYKKYATSVNTGCTPYQEMLRTIYTPHQEIHYIVHHSRKYKKDATSGNTGCEPYHEMSCMSEEQFIRQISRYNILYATSRNTKSTPHQEIQDVRHIRKC